MIAHISGFSQSSTYKPPRLLHSSQKTLALGLILTPRAEGMAGIDDDIEDIVEANRPSQFLSRHSVIYMARNLRTLENVGRSDGHIYEVEAIGDCVRRDHAWLNRIWRHLAKSENKNENFRP